MQLKYNTRAQETGSCIVGAAGWISMAADMGIHFLKSKFSGRVAYAETFCRLTQPPVN
jgi:short subunit dehydrogenase-like uncharacterized protein